MLNELRIFCESSQYDKLMTFEKYFDRNINKYRRMIHMMKYLYLYFFVMTVTLLQCSNLSHAEQYDDPKCFEICGNNYNKCVADVINNPEPRTYVEQQTLDACHQTHSDCEHSCENTNMPLEDKQKQEESN